MGQWSRAEIEREFGDYQRRAADAGQSGDWRGLERAVHRGRHLHRAPLRDVRGYGRPSTEWISSCMADYPGRDMPEFPIEWYVIDEDAAGWCARCGTG